jgi:FHA domain
VRRRAWAAAGMRCGDSLRRPLPSAVLGGRGRAGLNGKLMAKEPRDKKQNAFSAATPNEGGSNSRFLLWVDGVGGYLVCTADEVILGQPVPGSQVDVPILGDISRRHARIRRDGENYLIDPLRSVRLDGREIERATTLSDGELIELGDNVRLRFRRPHALSRTARLEFVSHHRTLPSADAVLLAAESCVLGPGANSHIVCRNWSRDVVLYRQGADWHCRAAGPFEIDGAPANERAAIGERSRIAADDFSLSLETI